ncbi:MAG: hypothetical protein ACR2HH_05195 [Chthoniobacterales bacterium]
MDVWIARDGVEMGTYPQADLRDLARSGELQLTDHYWYEGLEEWGILGTLLGAEAWKPPEQTASRQEYVRLITAGVLVFLVVCAIAFRLSQSSASSAATRVLPSQPSATGPSFRDIARTDPKLREKAKAALAQLIEKLPRASTPHNSTVYYAIETVVPVPPALLAATITGAEDTVDPSTQETLWHTPFVLVLVYRDSQWMYSDYRATMNDMKNGEVTEIDGRQKAAIPPTIVSILGVKAVPDLARPDSVARP